MFNSSIAVMIAAATAGITVVVTEPKAGMQNDTSQAGITVISRTAVKGNRLDMRPAASCAPREAAPDLGGEGAIRHQNTPYRLPGSRIVLVGLAD